MANLIDSKMPALQQEQAKKILIELKVDNLKVHFDAKSNLLVFERDRRVVSVPVKLIEENLWSDIRFLFRATLNSQNSLWNRAADDNDWSGKNHYDE
ncbi:MAG: hypothetical protein V4596_08850 [Bdellovibrionota bacterium]